MCYKDKMQTQFKVFWFEGGLLGVSSREKPALESGLNAGNPPTVRETGRRWIKQDRVWILCPVKCTLAGCPLHLPFTSSSWLGMALMLRNIIVQLMQMLDLVPGTRHSQWRMRLVNLNCSTWCRRTFDSVSLWVFSSRSEAWLLWDLRHGRKIISSVS